MAVAELGQRALAGTDPSLLMGDAVARVAQVLELEYCKVLELLPDRKAFLLRAGVGWQEGLVGQAIVGAEEDSQAGYTLQSNRPVIVEDLGTELRFSGPPLLLDHGVVSGVSVVIGGEGRPFGVMGAHSTRRRAFTRDDVRFLQAVANVMATAIERKQADANLEERTAYLSALINNNPLAIAVLDIDGGIRMVNPSFLHLFDYRSSEVVGKRLDELIVPVEEAAEAMELTRRSLAGERVHATGRRRREDGTLVEVEFHGVPLLVGGRLVGSYVLYQDITERRHLEHQLVVAQRMEAVGLLAGGIAHDFNNLLSVVLGYSDLLLTAEADHNGRPWIEEIKKAAELATSLTRQLLAFSRQQVLRPQVLDLNEVVAEIGKLLLRVIGQDIELVTKPGAELGAIEADPGQLEQVLVNLVLNARDAMPQGGKLTLETKNVELDEDSARANAQVQPGSYVMLTITDTGEGMDKETQARIFEPFFTTKEKGKGTGLGLATVYGIVKQSAGSISVYSKPGLGTTFEVCLPRVAAAVAAGPRRAVKEATLRREEPRTVLLVEDETPLRALLRELLHTLGYTVLETAEAGEAMQRAAQHDGPIDVLITDVVMPGLSGSELAEQLLARRPETKVLYVSGNPGDAIRRHGVLDPGMEFLPKPFTIQALELKLEALLGTGEAGA